MEVPRMFRMLMSSFVCALSMLSVVPVAAQEEPAAVPTPEAVFGFSPGADRLLIDYSQLVEYLELLAASSPRVSVIEIGRTTLDRPMMMAVISSAENMTRLDDLKEINRRLALDPAIPDAERADLVDRGRVFVMATLSMHSSEVGPSQTLPILVHDLATATDAETLTILDAVVVMAVASLNPDGMDMIVEHYRESLDTPYEGASMPGLYHHYVGHDNNRDFVSLNLAESRNVSRVYSTEWYPQVLIDKHQMGRTGPRYFVPRYHDPIAENVDGKLWNWSDVFGSAMGRRLGTRPGAGVASNWVFDDYWPGSTTTSHWKGVISMLTEAASCKLATPVFVEPNERRVRGKGLSEYKKSVNMPDPWPGGWWRLSDIVAYELASWRGALEAASSHRDEILRLRNDLCREEVERGRSVAPAYFVIPGNQHDPSARDRMVALLVEHGVEIAGLTGEVTIDDRRFNEGDLVVPLAQPYRPFVKEVMEVQRYPVRRYTPGGEIIKPYDITSWSLPLHFGVETVEVAAVSDELEALLADTEIEEAIPDLAGAWGAVLDPRHNASYRAVFETLGNGGEVLRSPAPVEIGDRVVPAGAFVLPGARLEGPLAADGVRPLPVDARPEGDFDEVSLPRVALIETWYHDMDAGWTRMVLERNGIDYTLLRPAEVAGAALAENFDVVIFPDAHKDVLTEGAYSEKGDYRPTDYRPEFRKGLGSEGMAAVSSFLEAGGRVVAWGRSTALFFDAVTFGEGDDALELDLPVHDQAEKLAEAGFYAPGSLLEVELLTDHPLTWGMPEATGAFSRGRPVLGTSLPILVTDRRVVGSFPDEGPILMSGYAEHDELLAGQPAMVWVRAGRGQLVLFGFQPQFRGSTPGTYKLLFNALLLPEVEAGFGGVAGSIP
jgi:hypothetical protein